MNKKILPINLADIIISCNFGENYAKILLQYFNQNFDYTTFEMSQNGIVKTVDLNVKVNKQVIPFRYEFVKTSITGGELTISCLYQNIFQTSNFKYKNFNQFADIFEHQLLETNHELQKFYIQ